MDEPFDIFISYKTEDANEVREVAECLLANGIKPWFAEYEIRAEIYDDGEAVQKAIDDGIAQARYALVFTNDRWASSEFCALEMEGILRALGAGSENIRQASRPMRFRFAEVFIPRENGPHERWPALKNVPSIVYQGQLDQVIEFINDLGWFDSPLKPDAATGLDAAPGRHKELRYGYGLDPTPFSEKPKPDVTRHSPKELGGERYYFEKETDAGTIGLSLNLNPYQSVLGSLSVSKESSASDRAVYKAYREYAKGWLERHGKSDRGVHLYFWNGRSHLALTCVNDEAKGGRRFWERRYFLVLPGMKPGLSGELEMSFGMYLPEASWRPLQTFCGFMRGFDRIVATVRQRPSKIQSGKEIGAVLLVKAFLALLAIDQYVHIRSTTAPRYWKSLFAGLVGLFSADVVLSLFSREIRRETDHLGTSLGSRTRPAGSPGRALYRAWNLAVGSIVHDLMTLMNGVFNVGSLMCALTVVALSLPVPTNSQGAWVACGAVVYVFGFVQTKVFAKQKRNPKTDE